MDVALIQSCSICHGALTDDPQFSIPDCCGHVFHKGCLATWYESRKPFTCPICRQTGKKMIDIKLFVEPPMPSATNEAINGTALKSKFERLQEEFKSVHAKLLDAEDLIVKQKCDHDSLQQRLQEIEQMKTQLSERLRIREQQLRKQKKELLVYRQSEQELQGEGLEGDIWQEFSTLENDQQCNYLKSMHLQMKQLRRECEAKSARLLALQRDLEKAVATGTRTENKRPAANSSGNTPFLDPHERPKKKIRPMFRT